MTSDAITITGSDNAILLKGDADTVSVLRGSGNRITLSGTVGTMVLASRTPRLTAPADRHRRHPHVVRLHGNDKARPHNRQHRSSTDGVQITMTVPDKVKAGGSLTAKVSFSGVRRYLLQSLVSDSAIKGCTNNGFRLTNGKTSSHTSTCLHQEYEDQRRSALKLLYNNPSTETEQVYARRPFRSRITFCRVVCTARCCRITQAQVSSVLPRQLHHVLRDPC